MPNIQNKLLRNVLSLPIEQSNHNAMKKILLALAALLLVVSCNNSKKQQTEEQTPATEQKEIQQQEAQQPQEDAQIQEEPDVAVADIVGYYDSFNQEGGNEERVSILENGTATWNMIGSLHFSEYTYKIKGNRIYMTLTVDNSEAGYYDYDPEKKTLTSEGGTVYFLQK